jgi:hypothetical protein
MKKLLWLVTVGTALGLAACSRNVNAQNAGAAGLASAQTSSAVRVADTKPAAPAVASDLRYREVSLPAGTKIGVRMNSSVSSYASRVEEPVDATVIAPVRIGQSAVVPAGSHVRGDVVVAERSARVKGRARLDVRFRTLTVGSESYPIAAEVSRVAPATKLKDAEKIAIPAAGGAVIGAIVGGKKGAAIGAAAGGGAGTAVVLSTPGKEVSIPKGSVVALRLQKAVTVRVPVK